MTIAFYGTSSGLFDILGKAFQAQTAINTARGTTVPTETLDLLTIYANLTITAELQALIAPVNQLPTSVKADLSSPMSALSTFCSQFVVSVVNSDNQQPNTTIKTALIELIAQMVANSESVDASTSAVTATAGGSNTGNGAMVVSAKRGDGLLQENIIAESVMATANSTGANASFQCLGEPKATLLSADWPLGSGCNKTVTSVTPTTSLLTNGDFETEANVDNKPDSWIASVATIGTTLKMTNVEVQQIAVTGSPSAGHYLVNWANAAADVQTTVPVAYNAGGSTLQQALRQLTGLESVTVTTTGTTPNFTHQVTFTGMGGNVAQFTITNNTTGGTVTPTTLSAGTAFVFSGGKAVEFDSNGSEQTTIQQRLENLLPSTAYAVSLWAVADVVPAAGVVTIDLVDGIGGTVIADDQAVNNAFTFDAADLTTSWQHLSDLVTGECVFRTPAVIPSVVYFRIRISTAISSGTSMFIDHASFVAMTELYAGGPLVAAFSGSVPFVKGDVFTIATTNDRAGLLQEWFQRNFDMAGLGLLLPSDNAASETVPDSVVA